MNANHESLMHTLQRRRLLASLGALGASALLPGCQTSATRTPGQPFRIDVHHHYVPDAYDKLKADGISLMTSYNGKYLGDPSHWPILEELNRRKAVVYTHPTTPACCGNLQPFVSINAIEGPVDTTRTMVSLMFQGGAAKFPDIQWIFSHSGGVTPFLLSR